MLESPAPDEILAFGGRADGICLWHCARYRDTVDIATCSQGMLILILRCTTESVACMVYGDWMG